MSTQDDVSQTTGVASCGVQEVVIQDALADAEDCQRVGYFPILLPHSRIGIDNRRVVLLIHGRLCPYRGEPLSGCSLWSP